MTDPKRMLLRPVPQTSILDKRFRPVLETTKRVRSTRVHPLVVLADMKRGSLKSLARYLEQENGIPDAMIARRLRAMITGDVCDSDFQIRVIDHPDLPKAKGGRPAGQSRTPTRVERAVADDLIKYSRDMPVEAAVATVAAEHRISPSAVYKYGNKVAAFDKTQQLAQNAELEREAELQVTKPRTPISASSPTLQSNCGPLCPRNLALKLLNTQKIKRKTGIFPRPANVRGAGGKPQP